MPKQNTKTMAYLRVSTEDQDTEKFKRDIKVFANDRDFGKVAFVEEKVSGRKHWKDRKIKTLIDDLGKGDRLIVPELSRLGRSTKQILDIIQTCREKGICVYAIKNGWSFNGKDSSLSDKIILTVFSLIAEIESDIISLRTREGLAAAKARGKLLGRPRGPGKSKLDPHREEIIELLLLGLPKTRIAQKYKTTPVNLWNWLKKNQINIKQEDVEVKIIDDGLKKRIDKYNRKEAKK